MWLLPYMWYTCDICDTAIQEICGYQLSCWKIVGTFFLVLFTAGLILVLITWRKDIKVQCTWCTWYTRSHLLLSFPLPVHLAVPRGQAGRRRKGFVDRPPSSSSPWRVSHQVGVKKNSVRFVEFVVLLIWNYVPDFNPSCFSWTRRTSTFGTRRFNSSENSETSTRASTNRISSKCRSRETENDLRQNKSMIRL